MPSAAPGLVKCCSSIESVCVPAAAIWLAEPGGVTTFAKSKVENLGVSALRDENVGRLDVAVDDAFGVSGVERVSNLNRQAEQYIRLHGLPAMRCFKVIPSRNSMAMNGLPVLLANFINRADVGMVQCGCGLGLALKTGECLRVTGDLLGQELEGDEAMQRRVLGLVDDAHPAAPELLDDAVVRDGLADHAQGCYGGNMDKSMKAGQLAAFQKVVGIKSR